MTNNKTRPAPRPPAPRVDAAGRVMTADTDITDPTTGEVIAEAGDVLTDEDLYRLECIGVEIRAARARRCPHYGAEVPHEFTGCAECPIARECYELYERTQDARASACPKCADTGLVAHKHSHGWRLCDCPAGDRKRAAWSAA